MGGAERLWVSLKDAAGSVNPAAPTSCGTKSWMSPNEDFHWRSCNEAFHAVCVAPVGMPESMIPGWHETVLASRGQTGAKLWNCRTPSHTLPRGQGDCGGRSFCQPDADSTSGPGPATQQPATQQPATQLPATQLPATEQPATLSPSATRANAPSSTSCSTNFGPVPGFYESGARKYVAIQHSQHVS